MHACLNVDEIIRLIACELVASEAKATAVSLASCCRSFEGPILDALWGTQDQLRPLLKCLPGDIWKRSEPLSFQRVPTALEWARFRSYSRRMRTFSERGDLDILSPKAFSILRLCAIDGPLFPNLKTLELWPTIGGFVPFIPLFLSHRTLVVTIQFTEPHPKAVIASMITTLPTLCPNLREITLTYLPRHPMITAAVSGMLLAIDRDNLRWFHVDSPLTEEAREVVYGLSNLQGLTVVAEKSTPLPLLMFPDLYNLAVRYDCGSDWLRMFHRTTLEGLKDVVFLPRSEHIDDILEAFERVAVAASTQKTLSGFRFNTSHSWNPNYSSLLPFTQLETLDIEFSCDDGCSSSVDDDIIADIAQAMPKLEILCLGRAPCRTPTGVTAKGLTTLAYHCLHLSTLRIHFQVASLHPPVILKSLPVVNSPFHGEIAL